MTPFAPTPEPPYYAAIFTTTQTGDLDGYQEMAARMAALAAGQPGYLGIESVHSASVGITVSYWTDAAAIGRWRADAEHTAARERGRGQWYDHYVLRVARVERSSEWERRTERESGG